MSATITEPVPRTLQDTEMVQEPDEGLVHEGGHRCEARSAKKRGQSHYLLDQIDAAGVGLMRTECEARKSGTEQNSFLPFPVGKPTKIVFQIYLDWPGGNFNGVPQ